MSKLLLALLEWVSVIVGLTTTVWILAGGLLAAPDAAECIAAVPEAGTLGCTVLFGTGPCS